jgi:hypothetical protein
MAIMYIALDSVSYRETGRLGRIITFIVQMRTTVGSQYSRFYSHENKNNKSKTMRMLVTET